MKRSQTIISLLLLLILSVSALFACAPIEVPEEGSSSASTEAVGNPISLSGDGLSAYKIIYDADADFAFRSEVTAFALQVGRALGVSLKTEPDSAAASIGTEACEIVIGRTNRPGTTALLREIREKDFIIAYKNKRIYIVGGSEEATAAALDYFEATYVKKDTQELALHDRLHTYVPYDYTYKSVLLNGVDIRSYTVILPRGATACEEYTAENLISFFEENAGFTLKKSSDRSPESEYEILIGKTNRVLLHDRETVVLEKDEYLFYMDGTRLVIDGDGVMVAGGVGDLLYRLPVTGKNQTVELRELPTAPTKTKFVPRPAQSAILMIGDGMGENSIKMAMEQLYGTEIGGFAADMLPYIGNAYTGSLTTAEKPTSPTDSAASGTALATGQKTYNNYIGVDGNKNPIENLRELAEKYGANTGVLTTDVITGATPSAFLAHTDHRNNTEIIQAAINDLISKKKIDICEGSLGDELRDETEEALLELYGERERFFLMVEEGYIDKNSHNNKAPECIDAVERLNDAVTSAIVFVLCHPDTVLIVTADHETGGIKENEYGSFVYTTTQHTTANVPVYAIGMGCESFDGKTVDNTDIPKFLATIYGASDFGE